MSRFNEALRIPVVWVAAGVASLCTTVVAVLICAMRGMPLDWGNVATWVSAAASASVAITLTVVTVSRNEREDLAQAKLRAVGVTLWFTKQGSQPRIFVENQCGESIYHLQVGRVCFFNRNDLQTSQIAGRINQSRIQSGIDGNISQLLQHDGEPELKELKDREGWTFVFEMDDPPDLTVIVPLVGLTWTSRTGRRFTSGFPQASNGSIDNVPVWEYIGIDKSTGHRDNLFRP